MSSFLTNTIEVIDTAEVPSANNPYAPQYLQHSMNNEEYMFSYYNPYLHKRVNVLSFGKGFIPELNEKTIDKIAVDHYIEYNNIQNSREYSTVKAIVHKLNERGYKNAPSGNTIFNVKTHLHVIEQPIVDKVAAILRNEFVPVDLTDKIIQHAVEIALQRNRFMLKGGKKKTLQYRRRERKIRRKTRRNRSN